MIAYILLGILQGLTEFFPVSSSGHLAVAQRLFAVQGDPLAISVILHAGTLCSMAIFFFKEVIRLFRQLELLVFVVIVTVITGCIALPARHLVERLFVSPHWIAVGWVITGIILLCTARFGKSRRELVGIADAFILGIAQGIAVIPGISRAGITMSTLLFRNIDRQTCFRFSFVAAMPVLLGACIIEAKEIGGAMQLHTHGLVAGFIASFITGLIALWLLSRVMRKAALHYFGYYCIIIAVLTFIFVR